MQIEGESNGTVPSMMEIAFEQGCNPSGKQYKFFFLIIHVRDRCVPVNRFPKCGIVCVVMRDLFKNTTRAFHSNITDLILDLV